MHCQSGLNGRCFLMDRSVRDDLRTRMTDRDQICPNGRASPVTDVLARPCKWQHLVSSSKTVRPIIPRDARCMGHVKIRWSAVSSLAPHSQFAEEARSRA